MRNKTHIDNPNQTEAIFRILKEVIFETDVSGCLKYLNPAWTDLFGFDIGSSLGQQLTTFVILPDRNRFSKAFLAIINGKTSDTKITIKMINKSGSNRSVDLTIFPCKDASGKISGIFGTLLDVSAIVQLEQEIQICRNNYEQVLSERQKYQEAYKHIFNQVNDIILLSDSNGKIIDANHMAIKAYGYSYQELLTKNVTMLRHKNYLSPDIKSNLAKKTNIYEIMHCRKNGQSFPVKVSKQSALIHNQQVTICIVRDITERRLFEERLRYLATHDGLTNVPNRHSLGLQLDLEIRNARETGQNSSLLMIDLDNFKLVNDTYGHTAGDSVLIEAATTLRTQLEHLHIKYTLGRLSGDEFAILLRNADIHQAKETAENLCHTFERQELYLDGKRSYIRLTLSIGIVPIDGTLSSKRLFCYADAALYEAKHKGKSRVVVYDSSCSDERLTDTSKKLTLINEAIYDKRFMLHYQPVCSLDKRIIHYEALIRIFDDCCRIIQPNEFIPIAEKFGLMSQIDRNVVEIALTTLVQRPDLRVFINLSGLSLIDTALLDFIEQKVKDSGINPSRLGFEITETTAIEDLKQAEHWINHLKGLGSPFALDDFGFGFSSFSYLQALPVDYLKIDGSYVLDLDNNPTKKALIEAMNEVAHTLGKKTVAECVENSNTLDILRDLNIDYAQGYYLGKPSPLFA